MVGHCGPGTIDWKKLPRWCAPECPFVMSKGSAKPRMTFIFDSSLSVITDAGAVRIGDTTTSVPCTFRGRVPYEMSCPGNSVILFVSSDADGQKSFSL